MQKWMTVTMIALALGCARTTVKAQLETPAPAAPPAAAEAAEHAAHDAARARIEAQLAQEKALVGARAARAYGGKVKKEKASWLGVVTSPVSGALRKQVKLSHKGIGLVVDRVEPKSPAADAGLQQYDIIEKLDDQWLVNSQQFGVLIRMHNPGDEVSLTVIREAQPVNIRAKLAEKEMAVMDDAEGGVGWLGTVPGDVPDVFAISPQGLASFELPRMEMDTLLELDNLGDNATITINDGEQTLKISRKDGVKTLEATDKDGNEIFNGPIDTAEQREAIPEEVREKLEKFHDLPRRIKLRALGSTTAPVAEK
jgi:hypothetical protein